MFSSRDQRSFLRDALDASVAATVSLYVQLRAWETTARESIATGQTVAATSAGNAVGNRSVSFFPPSAGGLDPRSLLNLLCDLVDMHDASRLALISSGIVTPTDQQIFDEMMDRLQTVTSAQYSFACLRVA